MPKPRVTIDRIRDLQWEVVTLYKMVPTDTDNATLKAALADCLHALSSAMIELLEPEAKELGKRYTDRARQRPRASRPTPGQDHPDPPAVNPSGI